MANTPSETKDAPEAQTSKSVAMRFFGQTAGVLMAVGAAISIFHNPLHKKAEKLNGGQRTDNIIYNIGLATVGSVIGGLVAAAVSYFRGNKKEQQPTSTHSAQSSLNQTAPELSTASEAQQPAPQANGFSHTAAEDARRAAASEKPRSLSA